MERNPGIAVSRWAVVLALVSVALGGWSQKPSPADLAGKLSGTWILNRDLSTGLRAPGRRGGGADSRRPLFAVRPAIGQGRGGGGGGGATDPSDLTPEKRAEQAAMRQLQQVAEQIVIKGSADSVTFIDPRGERTYAINDKTAKFDVDGSPVSVKSKWDKNALKQEFSNTQAKLVETWSVDEAGRLLLTAKVESMTLITPEQKAIYDRK